MNAPDPSVVAQMGSTALPLSWITPSPTNPRKHFDKAALAELTESVRKHGIIQPVLVRSRADVKNQQMQYELVAGERRYRAAKAAGLAEIPAIVRILSDAETLELQVIENLQREDLHPLEEAEGYDRLIKEHHYTAESLAAKLGKSKAYVYARLKFMALTPKAREAFYDGKLNPSTAILVARIPVARLQERALQEITEVRYAGAEPMGVRAAMQHLQQHYMLRLADAPFPTGDEKLVAKAGTCAACPKRTGNQPELFGDVKGADVCTDPECFDGKKEAHIVRVRAAAEAKGQRVISGKEAKRIIPYATVDDRSGFIELDAKNWNDPKARTNRALLGKECPEIVLVEHPESRKLVEVVAAKHAAPILKAKAPSILRSSNRRGDDEQQKKRAAKAKLETAVNARIFDAVAAKHTGQMTAADAAIIAAELFDRTDHEGKKRVLRLWEPEAFEKAKNDLWSLEGRFSKRIPALSPTDLVRLMVQLAIVGDVHLPGYSSHKPDKLVAAAERLKVDVAAIRRELAPAKPAKKAAKKAAPKKSPRKTNQPKKEST